MLSDYERYAKKFKAFCDPNRLWIMDLIKHHELCACELLDKLDVSQSTLSHHMKILAESGMVNVRKDGKWSHYSVSSLGLIELEKYVSNMK